MFLSGPEWLLIPISVGSSLIVGFRGNWTKSQRAYQFEFPFPFILSISLFQGSGLQCLFWYFQLDKNLVFHNTSFPRSLLSTPESGKRDPGNEVVIFAASVKHSFEHFGESTISKG